MILAKATIIVYFALNPCPITIDVVLDNDTQTCMRQETYSFSTYGNCLGFAYTLPIEKRKIRKPVKIYKEGGGSSVSVIPCTKGK